MAIHCAVSPDVNDNLILTADVVQRLAQAQNQIMRHFDETESQLKAESTDSDYTCNNKADYDSDMHYVEQVSDLCNYRSADNDYKLLFATNEIQTTQKQIAVKSTQNISAYLQLILQLNIVSLYDVGSMDSRTIQHIATHLINSTPFFSSTILHNFDLFLTLDGQTTRSSQISNFIARLNVVLNVIDKLVFAASNISTANTSGRRCDGQIDDHAAPTSSRLLFAHSSYLYSVD